MPEMPEVETIRRELEEMVKGRKIVSVDVRLAKPLTNATAEEFEERVKGAKIEGVRRRAKLIILELSTGQSLLIHLKLTGRLLYARPQEPLDAHTHIVFHLDDGCQLRFWDLRRFGYIKLGPAVGGGLEEMLELAEFGPEALEMTLGEFKNLLVTKKRGKVKPLLMEQKFISGLGNIYSDEVLHYAGVQPTRDISTLTEGEKELIYEGIQTILPVAVKHRGSSVDLYVDIYGRQGEYVPHLQVYGREGESCYRCGAPIKRIKLGGRSAHFCPNCQK